MKYIIYSKNRILKIVTLLLILGIHQLSAQVTDYTFTQLSGTYTEITGGTVLGTATGTSGALSLDDIIYNLPAGTIPFNFTYDNQVYTGCNVSTNGFITFGATAPAATVYNPISNATAYTSAISALGCNINGYFFSGIPAQTATLSYAVSGTTPNRVFVIQWKNFKVIGNAGTTYNGVLNFQIRLSETSNKIEIMYNNNGTIATTTAQVGLRGPNNTFPANVNNRLIGAANTWAASLVGTANTSSCQFSTTLLPASGQTYRYSAPLCPNAQNLTTSNITTNQAQVSWTTIGGGGTMSIEFGPAGFTPGTGTTVSNITSPYTIAGLSSQTNYQYYLQQNCTGLGNGVSSKTTATFKTGGLGEDCSTAPTVTVSSSLANCSFTTVNSGVSQNGPNAVCSDVFGNVPSDDVWYKFVAPSGGNKLVITTQAGTVNDWVMEVWSNCPGAGSVMKCSDDVNAAMPEISLCQNEYVAGQTYYIRAWTYSNTAVGTMNLCVYQDVACALPPANDECVNAVRLNVNPPLQCASNGVTYTTANATASGGVTVTCDTNTPNDVWFVFNTGSFSDIRMTIAPVTATGLKAQLVFACGSFEINCYNPANGTYLFSGLNPSADYIIRVWSSTGGTFSICLEDVCSNPTASLSGTPSVCPGQSADMSVNFTGVPPFTFSYSNGTTTTPVTTSNNPYTLTVSPAATTNYSLVSMSDAACSGTVSGTGTVTIINPQNATLNTFTPVCSGAGLQTLTGGSPAGGVYSGTGVSNGKFDPTVGTQTITYTVTYATGCTRSASAVYTVNPTPIVTLAAFDSSCVNATPFTLTGGSPTGGFYSGTGVTSNVFNPATAGVGTTTITYSYSTVAGCSSFASNTIKVVNCVATCSNPPTANAGIDKSVCGTGSVSVTGIIGGAATSATWSGGAGTYNPNSTSLTMTYTPTAAERTAGQVKLILTTNDPDGTGPCVAVKDTMIVTINPLPTVTLGTFSNVCNNAASFTLTGGSPSGGTYSGIGVTNNVFTPATAGVGTFVITYTYTNGNGCTSSATSNITVTNCTTCSNPPSANAGGDKSICGSGSVGIVASIGGGATSATWSGGTGVFSPNTTSLSITYTPSASEISAGLAKLILTTNDPDGTGPCVAGHDTVAITINPLPNVTFSPLSSVCINASSFTLTGGSPAGGTYSGTGVSGGVFNPATAGSGTFTLTYSYTNGNGCTSSATSAITVNSLPSVTLSALTSVCVNAGAFALTGGSPAGGTYSGTGITNNIFNPATAGTGTFPITYSYTNGNGCTSSATSNITVNPLPSVTFGALSSVCVNAGAFALTGGSPAGGTYSGTGISSNVFNPAISGVGTFTLTYTYTNGNGCTSSATSTITVNAIPAVTFSALSSRCINAGTLTLTGGSPAGGTYSGTGVSAGIFNPVTSGVGTFPITYTYTNGNGCTSSATSNITVNALPTVTLSAFTSVCTNTAAFTMSGGLPTGGTYTGTGVSNNIFNPVAAGTGTFPITYSFTNANGCTQTATANITVNTIPTVTLGTFSSVCASASSFALTGGLPAGGTYSGTGVSGNTFNPGVAGAGTFVITYTYTNANGCSSSASSNITVNPLPSVSQSALSSVCVNASPFTLSGGSPAGGTYSGIGVANNVFTPATAGVGSTVITYTYTNGNGCTSSATTIISVTSGPNVTLGTFANVCAGTPSFTLTGGSPSGGTYTGSGVSGGVFNPATAGIGTFVITYTYTNGNGCTSSANSSISVLPLPNVTFSTLPGLCSTSSPITLVQGSPSGGTYSGTGVSAGTFNPATSGAGTFVLTYIYTNGNGCTSSATSSITVVSNPVVSLGSFSSICQNGSSVTLTGGSPAGGTYSGTGVSGGVFNPASSGAGTFLITYTYSNAGGCTSSASSNITVNPTPAVTMSAIPSVCINSGSFTLTGGSPVGGTYVGTGVSGGIFNPATAGVGSFQINYNYTDANSCSATDKTILTVNALPSVTLSALSSVCSNTTSFTLTGGSPAGGTYSGTGVSGGEFNPAISGTGTFVITYTYTNGNGCTSSATSTITVNPLPVVTLNPFSAVCRNTAAFTLTGGSPAGGTYSGTGVTNNIFNPATAGAGTFVITYTYTNANGCTSSATSSITVTAQPTVTLGSFSNVCNNAASFTLTGGSPTGGTYSGVGVTNNIFTPSTAGVGTFVITYTYTTGGCVVSASSSITVTNCTTCSNPPSANAGVDKSVCGTGSVSITGTIGGAATTSTWSGGTGTYNPNTTSLAITYTPSAAERTAGKATLILTTNDPDGTGPCVAGVDTMVITINALPAVSFSALPSVCISASSFTLTGGSPAGGTYSGTGVSGGLFNPATAGAGTFTLTYTYTNGNGCTSSATSSITVNALPAVTLSALQSVCLNTSPVTLSGGTPAGGTYSGTGVTAGVFNPATSGAGTFPITYTYTNGNGCTSSATSNITVNALPSVTLSAFTGVCINAASFALTGGSPAGGTYSGTGVSAGVFNPSSAGAGTFIITYTYTNGNGCTSSATSSITVNPLPVVTLGAFSNICNNASPLTLTGGSPAGGTYSGTGVSGGVFNPATAGVGTFVINYSYTNGNGCTSSATSSITVTNCTGCTNAPTANAGADKVSCSGGAVTLAGSFGGAATSASWQGGLGVFNPSRTSLTATYTPTAAEVTSGQVMLILLTNDPDGTGPCVAAKDTMYITMQNSPVAGAITGTTGICKPQSGVVYSIPAISGVSYAWTVPSGVTITSGQGTNSIVASWSSTGKAGNVCVTITNGCGSTQSCFAVALRTAIPSRPSVIAGLITACKNTSSVYTISKVTTADYYVWTPPAGTTINGSSVAVTVPDTSVTVVFGSSYAGDSLRVYSGNCFGVSATRALYIGGIPLPATPGSITGFTSACKGETTTYSIRKVANATYYTWTPPAGSTINGSSVAVTVPDTLVTVVFNATTWAGDTIKVKAGNCTGISANKTLKITKRTTVPSTPASIKGQANGLCNPSPQVYYIAKASGAVTYTWRTSFTGGFINGFASPYTTTDTIVTVTFPNPYSANGTLYVKSNNACGSSPERSLTLNRLTAAATGITGPTTSCTGATNVAFSISAIPYATSYLWTVPAAATLVSGQGTTSILLNFNTVAGNRSIVVKGVDACGSSTGVTLVDTVKSCPRFDHIAGSDAYNVDAYPNPVKDLLHVEFTATENARFNIQIMDIDGRVLNIQEVNAVEGLNKMEIQMNGLANGIYILSVQGPQGTRQMRIVVGQ